ncbi:MAG TPA: hypothetical protein VHP36_03245 [Chitinispirillaceae bacterium]|nr:hypothetical protein [Chitinispirillaceae bacterium]
MSDFDKDIKNLSVLGQPLRLEPQPFHYFANKLGISVEQTIELIKTYIDQGIIRRFAGILKHQKAGYHFNAMVAFQIDNNECDAAGETLSRLSFVTHCYRRKTYPDWPYNLYAMMHARNEDEFNQRISEIKAAFPCISVAVLPTLKEFKKSIFQLPTDQL